MIQKSISVFNLKKKLKKNNKLNINKILLINILVYTTDNKFVFVQLPSLKKGLKNNDWGGGMFKRKKR